MRTYALGKLPDERYSMPDGQYAKKQQGLNEEIKTLEVNITAYDKKQNRRINLLL